MILRRPFVFTPREAAVLEELCRDGATNREIGDRMGLSFATVKVHMGAIKRKLKAKNRSHIIIIYLKGHHEYH